MTGKHLCQRLFFNKVAGRDLQLYWKRDSGTAPVFSNKFWKIFWNTFLTGHLRATTLVSGLTSKEFRSNYISPYISSVIKQKGESQNGSFKKTKHAKSSEKLTFLTPWYAHVCGYKMFGGQEVKNVLFSENSACFVFLKHPFLDSPVCLITDDFTR